MSRLKRNLLISAISLFVVIITFSILPRPSIVSSQSDFEVDVWITDGDESRKLEKIDSVYFKDNELTSGQSITIDVNEMNTYQEMDGFGAALSGSSAHLISRLPISERNQLLEDLFGSGEDQANFSFVRLTMGASDFNPYRYTYNDLSPGEEDLDLEHFSIEDDSEIIEVVKDILAINPDVKFLASPWTAPAWMKDNGSLNGGQLKPEYFDVYADYFIKFIEAYQEEGIPIYAVTVQNEPHHESSDSPTEYAYPTMKMTASDQAEFVKNHLGPKFDQNNIDTKIIIWDHNWDEPDYPLEILEDEETKSYIAGTGFHCYGGDVSNQSYIHAAHPDKGIWFTECSGGQWATNFGDNLQWNMENIAFGSINNWSKSVLLWNMALDENSGPITPPQDEGDTRETAGCSDCRGVVTIDSKTNEVTKNVEYYILGHLSKFVEPGAKRIESPELVNRGIENLAFINPDGSKSLLVMNTSNSVSSFKVRWGSQAFDYELEAGSVATFTWSGEQLGDTIISGLSRIQAESFHEASADLNIGVADDIGGGSFVGGIEANDYIKFSNVELVGGIASVQARVATAWDSGFELRIGGVDGHLIGKVSINGTGDWHDWQTIIADVDITGFFGLNDLYLVFDGPVNFNWFQFSSDHLLSTLNYLKNPGFERTTDDFWLKWHPEGQDSAQSVTTGGTKSGKYKVDFWSVDDYEQSMYQNVKVPNGTYSFSTFVRYSGDQDILRLEVKKFGGETITKELDTSGVDTWTEYSIDNILVTDGQIEVGVYTNANGGNWANFDDFSLQRVINHLPTEATNQLDKVEQLVAEEVEGGEINLSWNTVEGAEGYKIYRSKIINGEMSPYIEHVVTKETVFQDYGLDVEVTYNYVVTSYDANGESEISESLTVTTDNKPDLVAPSRPAGLLGDERIEAVELYWDHNTELDFNKYKLYQDGEYITSFSPMTKTIAKIESLQGNQEYNFSISAVDRYGNESELSESITLTPRSKGEIIDLPNMGFETGNLEQWSGDGEIDDDLPRTGTYKLTHYIQNGELYTYRVEEVPNGIYSISTWVRAGDLDTLQLQVRNFGSDNILTENMFSNSWDAWTHFSIDNIEVTNGQIEFGVYSSAGPSGGWAGIDDFELIAYEQSSETSEDSKSDLETGEDSEDDSDIQTGEDPENDLDSETGKDPENESDLEIDDDHFDGSNDDSEIVDVDSLEEEKTENEGDSELPHTATNMYRYLLIGVTIVLLAFILFKLKNEKSEQYK